MSEDSALSTTTKARDAERNLEVALEAARRATWDALHGPKHLRSGRYRPLERATAEHQETTPSDLAEGAAQQ